MVVDYDFMAELARDYEYQYQVEELYGKLIAKYLDIKQTSQDTIPLGWHLEV